MRNTDWDDYRYVLALHRAGSIAGAARALGVDGTTVARRLSLAESALGTRLFDRERGRVVPTEAAAAVVARLLRVDEELAELRDTVSGADTRVEGEVRITAVPMIFDNALVPALKGLLAKHPGLRIEALVDGAVLGIVSRREADIAIRGARPTSDPDAVTRKLGELTYGIYCHRDIAKRGGDVDWIAYAHGSLGQPQAGWIDERLDAEGRRARLRGNDAQTLLQCLLQGLGKSLLPDALAREHPELERLEPDRPTPTREVWMLMHPSGRQVRRIQVVADWTAAAVREFLIR